MSRRLQPTSPERLAHRRWLVAALAIAWCTIGCGERDGAGRASAVKGGEEIATPAEVLHTGDLAEIRADGRLRVLVTHAEDAYLPRSGSPLDLERGLAAELARDLGLEVEFVTVEGLDDLIPALLEGRGDLIADNFTVTPARRARVAFSTPVTTVSELRELLDA